MMLTRELDHETEQLLVEILQLEKVTREELLKTLIRDRWYALHQTTLELHLSTVAEPPTPPLSTSHPVAKPRNEKQMIADFIRKKRFH